MANIELITVNGSKDTTLFYFPINITPEGVIAIHPGEYYQQGEKKVELSTIIELPIEKVNETLNYNISLTTDGITVMAYGEDEFPELVPNLLCRLAYFTVPANQTLLDDIVINVVRTVEVNES